MEQIKTRSLVLKLWQEELCGETFGFRGEVRDPVSRETKYFTDWKGLQMILESNLSIDDQPSQPRPIDRNLFSKRPKISSAKLNDIRR